MINTIKTFGILSMCIGFSAFGQQTQLSSLYNNNYIMINPAETGQNNVTDFTLNYRKQWAGYTGAPSTAWLSGQTSLRRKSMGLGGVVLFDEMAFIRNIDAKISYAYHLKLAADLQLSFGLAAGIIQNTINYSGVIAEDYTDDILSNGNFSGIVFDAQFGTVIKFKDLNVGMSLPQLLQPKNQLPTVSFESNYDLKSHLNLYANYKYSLNTEIDFLPTVMYRRSKASSQFDVFANFMFNSKVMLGLGMRQSAGIMFSAGIKLKDKLQLNYAYEFGRNGAASSTGGTHEIMLKILLPKKNKLVGEGEEEETGN